MTEREERIQWLEALIADFEDMRNGTAPDEDPEATAECICEVKALARELRMELRMLATLHEQLASVAFEEHKQLPEWEIGGEG